MINKDTFKWFTRGFILTALFLLAVVLVIRPTLGWAQGGGQENSNANSQVVDHELSQASVTDDPAGRFSIPFEGNDRPISNREAMLVFDDNSSPPSTDDPAAATVSVDEQEITAQAYGSPLIIPGAAFTNDGEGPSDFRFFFVDGYVAGGDADTAFMKAPAYLPHGATVTQVCYTVYDNSNFNDVSVFLVRKNQFSSDSADTMSSLTSNWNDTDIHTVCDTNIDYALTDSGYAYYVALILPYSSTRLYSVRIYYSE